MLASAQIPRRLFPQETSRDTGLHSYEQSSGSLLIFVRVWWPIYNFWAEHIFFPPAFEEYLPVVLSGRVSNTMFHVAKVGTIQRSHQRISQGTSFARRRLTTQACIHTSNHWDSVYFPEFGAPCSIGQSIYFFSPTHAKITCSPHVCLLVRSHLHVAHWHNIALGPAQTSRRLFRNTGLHSYEQDYRWCCCVSLCEFVVLTLF